MFVNFIYTECNSPGPFKKESGFKFKSVVDNSDPNEKVVDKRNLEPYLDSITGSFLKYSAPAISPFMTQDEFTSLEKLWALQEVSAGNFVFTRQSTSGVSNGRPDNPFHQGFTYSTKDVDWVTKTSSELSGLEHPRPADFSTWDDWLSPRGDDQLEAAHFEEGNPPLPSLNNAQWASEMEKLLANDPASFINYVGGFEIAIRKGSNFGISCASDSEFLNWVSLLTHLLPIDHAWKIRFTSNGEGMFFKPGSCETVIFRNLEASERHNESPWAKMVRLILEAGLITELDRSLGLISNAFTFSGQTPQFSLHSVAIAAGLLEQVLIEDEVAEELALLIDQILIEGKFSATLSSREATEVILDRLENPESLASLATSREAIHKQILQIYEQVPNAD